MNKLEGHKTICTKAKLASTLRAYAAAKHVDLSMLIPQTFVMVAGTRAADAAAFDAAARLLALSPEAGDGGEAQWIVKPNGLNRGRGICVFADAAGVLAHLAAVERGSEWVVQRYIANPMLVRGRKFDIRQLVLRTPSGQVYMFRDSYVRTCSAEFSLADSDLSVHLTNDAVQKTLGTYGQFEDANKLSFAEFDAILRDAHKSRGGPRITLDDHIWPAMRESVCHVFRAAGKELNPRRLEHCFELLGFDFMVEADGALRRAPGCTRRSLASLRMPERSAGTQARCA